ncbi:hypothetical protein LSH36_463g02002 [Paralvinella palmiformis]|uniref:Thioredoxin domain-containing protein n=1 Tax=Paralvinella palmiformis TaxID=53620 RepID=A0AAD9JB22_9ANNE|nr:hypothetical protein LSH36_463g02002 [Paralvinella palmiformis]
MFTNSVNCFYQSRFNMMFLMLSLCLGVCLGDSGDVKMLTEEAYKQLAHQSELQVIYFKKELDLGLEDHVLEEVGLSTDRDAYDDRMLGEFYKEYSKSAKVLAEFDIPMYMVNCKTVKISEYCDKKDSHHNVYIFRGTELLNFSLDSMFDVDAIVSNILQIALLREVPILQSAQERREYEDEYKGKSNIVFSFQMAIGTKQHRALMEVAFRFKNKFTFAITTELSTVDGFPGLTKNDEVGLWLLQCKSSRSCSPARYYGRMIPEEISQFLNDCMVDNVIELTPENIQSEPFPGTRFHLVYVFYDEESSKFVRTHSEIILKKFKGTIGMIFINVDRVKNPYHDLLDNRPIPTIGFKGVDMGTIVFMPTEMEPGEFIEHQLEGYVGKMSPKQSQSVDDSDLDDPRKYLSEVERQDDQIALAMSHFHNKPLDDSSLQALTDKTFPIETTNRDLLIVLFYLPFDAMSSAVYHSFLAAADVLVEQKRSNPLSSVNCFDWTDVCQKENVTFYELPAPLEINSVNEFKQVVDGKIPKSDIKVDAIAIGLVKNEYSNEARMVGKIALELQGYMVVSMASGDVAQKISDMKGIPMSSLVIYKANDQFQPQVFTKVIDKTEDELVTWARQKTIPVFNELTPINLPLIYARRQPIVIYFMEPMTGTDSSHTMETYQSKTTTQEVMTSYTGKKDEDCLVTVILTEGHVFVYGDKLTDLVSIEKWQKAIKTNNVEPTKVLPMGDWKPRIPPYDFVKLMEEDNTYQKQRQDRVGHQLANEEEIIFDTVRESAPVTDKGDLIRGKDELPGMRIETTSTSQSVPPNVGRNEL